MFQINGFPVDTYPVMIMVALLTGILLYRHQLRQDRIQGWEAFYIAVLALSGGILGAKLPIIIMHWQELNSAPLSWATILSGRTIVGGLLGGFAATWGGKKLLGIEGRLGNQIAIPVAVGMAVGRIGCFLRGCCYGEATTLPWGVDFGDHIRRHPTQVYEIVFDIILAGFLIWKKRYGVVQTGELFRIFLNSYLSFRFMLEFIRVEPLGALGLTAFQWLCLVSLLYMNRSFIWQLINWRRSKSYEL